MNPKNKAIQLIDRFLDHSWSDITLKGEDYSKVLRASAKECALVHIDEILKLDLVQPLMRYQHNYISVRDFYSQVKGEILKL